MKIIIFIALFFLNIQCFADVILEDNHKNILSDIQLSLEPSIGFSALQLPELKHPGENGVAIESPFSKGNMLGNSLQGKVALTYLKNYGIGLNTGFTPSVVVGNGKFLQGLSYFAGLYGFFKIPKTTLNIQAAWHPYSRTNITHENLYNRQSKEELKWGHLTGQSFGAGLGWNIKYLTKEPVVLNLNYEYVLLSSYSYYNYTEPKANEYRLEKTYSQGDLKKSGHMVLISVSTSFQIL